MNEEAIGVETFYPSEIIDIDSVRPHPRNYNEHGCESDSYCDAPAIYRSTYTPTGDIPSATPSADYLPSARLKVISVLLLSGGALSVKGHFSVIPELGREES